MVDRELSLDSVKLIKKYEEIRKKIKAYQYIIFINGWDSATAMPSGSYEEKAKHIGVISEEVYKLQTSKEFVEVINNLYDIKDSLDEVLSHEIEVIKKENDKLTKIPMDDYVESQMLFSQSQAVWTQAKNANDFEMFKPYLEKIVDYKRRYINYLTNDDLKGYDILLDEYEKGMTMKEYDLFFDDLKEKLVPFVKEILSKSKKRKYGFAKKLYKKIDQEEMCKYIQKVMNFDTTHGVMMQSEHPFTSNYGTDDVRITVHYYEYEFTNALFSAIHELGHALYEQNVDKSLNDTFSGGGASMAMHESQSRFYENIIGRSKEFWQQHFFKLKEIFPKQLKDVEVEEFVKFINNPEATYIRTEADELTYPLHIMLRYDLEKDLISGKLEVKDLEKAWNTRFYEYFGIKVKKPKDGVLQDVHWSDGSFGYFPTYALGSAYSAQLFSKMKDDININEAFKKPTLEDINNWLKEKIHKYGSSKDSKIIFEKAVKEKFNAQYYIDYLINKYKGLLNE